MSRATDPLVVTHGVLREIAQELYRKFQPFSNNISIHIDEHGLVVYVHAAPGMFVLPNGPRDIRVTEGHEILQPPQY